MRKTERPCRHPAYGCLQSLFKVVEIHHPLILSLSKDGLRWFDKLTMSGGRRTLKKPCVAGAPGSDAVKVVLE